MDQRLNEIDHWLREILDEDVAHAKGHGDEPHLLDRVEASSMILDSHWLYDHVGDTDVAAAYADIILTLAYGYRHRPGYREEWAPAGIRETNGGDFEQRPALPSTKPRGSG